MQLDLLAAVRDALAERYAVEAEIGRGGMAVVCRARDLRHDRVVAIKVLYPELARAVGGDRFLREIGILAKLSHPNILPLLDSGAIEMLPGLSVPWYVMPFVVEDTLRTRLTREGPLPVPVAIRYCKEICAALSHAHSQGYIHRDIKPENILLRADQAVLADFGIARAVTVAGGGTLSSTGLVVGTPAYMSPEQSVGSDRLDGRSDIYSLGVVLYEMLAGHPPFTGATPQAISARHQFEPPPPIGVVRPNLPAGVQAVLEKALAKVAADRVQTAEELSRMIDSVASRAPAAAKRSRRTLVGVAAALGLATAAGLAIRAGMTPGDLDPNRYVVLPFQASEMSAETPLGGRQCQSLVTDVLMRWPDLGVVSPMTVTSAISTAGGSLDLRKALRVAQGLGAGRLVWGEVSEIGDTIRVLATLYDAGTAQELRSHIIRLPRVVRDLRALAQEFTSLTYSLVLPGSQRPAADVDLLGTTSLAGLTTYLSADSALNEWNLDLARRGFTEALRLDPDYPGTNLKLAQIGDWLDEPTADWRVHAVKAAGSAARLPMSDRPMATALMALADRDYPAACKRFLEMVSRDSTDFRAWWGLGECHGKDDIVLPDRASPSGWSFRGSYRAAVEAYGRALRTVPLSHRAFGGSAILRLTSLLATETNVLRSGHLARPDTVSFIAYPSLDHDTLAYVPYPAAEALGGRHLPPTNVAAVARNRALLRSITASWLAAFPASVPALEGHALVLELGGELAGPRTPDSSAIEAVTKAEGLVTGLTRLRLVATSTRLTIKQGDFEGARRLADSVLRAIANPVPLEAGTLAGIAAFTGRVHLAASYAARAASTQETFSAEGTALPLPPALRGAAARLLTYASFGVPAESLTTISAAAERQIRMLVSPEAQRAARRAILDRPAMLGFPVLRPDPSDILDYRIEYAVLRHDTITVRALFDQLADLRRTRSPAELSPDIAFLEARLHLAIGDTAGAVAQLDGMLENIRYLNTYLLDELPQTVGLIRGMALRAELSAAADDADRTKMWTAAVISVWREGDMVVQQVVTRMRELDRSHPK